MAMAPRIVVPSTLVRSFRRFGVREDDAESGVSSMHHGLALGVDNSADESVAIWGALRDLTESDAVLSSIVGGIKVVGAFTVWVRGASGRDSDEGEERVAVAAIASQALDATKSFSPQVAVVYVHESQRILAFSAATASPLEVEIVECAHASDFIASTDSVLIRASLSFRVDAVTDIAMWRAQVERDDATTVFFQFPEQPNCIVNARGESVKAAGEMSSELLNALVKLPEKRVATATSKGKKKKTSGAFEHWDAPTKATSTATSTATRGDFLTTTNSAAPTYLKSLEYGDISDVQVLQSLAFSPSIKGSPALTLDVASTPRSSVHIHADALVIVAQAASTADVVSALRAELVKQLLRLDAAWTPTATSLRSHHFALVGAAFPLTLPAVDDLPSPLAHTLATALLQPPTQPLFTPTSCSLVENATALATTDVLFNVHEGIPPSGVPNGTQYIVDGFYGYYHYLQQAMNDKGWGCAYRSLQTLASWLYWNHYTATPTLSHREIQQTLVAIGDKPPSFVGSREWIGSMEVGYVLDERFGISFRTLNVANGAQLVEKAQELKDHFEMQGTPVMMGGGQLAFTLLGIDYNAPKGECAFLILDPHYVGAEDLETIQTKTMALEGYKAVPCGWRKASSFSKTSFYNLCLPQRPVKAD